MGGPGSGRRSGGGKGKVKVFKPSMRKAINYLKKIRASKSRIELEKKFWKK